MKLLVTGARQYGDTDYLNAVLDCIAPARVIEGAARGADELAHRWAASRGVPNDRYPAEWNKYGRAAGPVRNKRMLDEGSPDLVVAFPEAGGRGTQNMMRQALKAGLTVIDATKLGGVPGCCTLLEWRRAGRPSGRGLWRS